MITSLKNQILLGLACWAVALSVSAADLQEPPPATKSHPGTLVGKIIFVDKSIRALAVEVKGKVLQINVLSRVRVTQGGKSITLEDLAPGQEVTVTFYETPENHLEVVAIAVEGSTSPSEAAAKQDVKSNNGKKNGPPDPFPGNGNPANLGGGPRSPHK